MVCRIYLQFVNKVLYEFEISNLHKVTVVNFVPYKHPHPSPTHKSTVDFFCILTVLRIFTVIMRVTKQWAINPLTVTNKQRSNTQGIDKWALNNAVNKAFIYEVLDSLRLAALRSKIKNADFIKEINDA